MHTLEWIDFNLKNDVVAAGNSGSHWKTSESSSWSFFVHHCYHPIKLL